MGRFLAISMDWDSGFVERSGSCMLDRTSGNAQVLSFSRVQVAMMYSETSIQFYHHSPVSAFFTTYLSP